jgi:hypothetical protein
MDQSVIVDQVMHRCEQLIILYAAFDKTFVSVHLGYGAMRQGA